jgi:arginyl-tRNA synthetase
VISLRKTLTLLFQKALDSSYPDQKKISQKMGVVVATKPLFGHFQFNGALALSKELKLPPRSIAELIIEQVKVITKEPILFSKLEIAGPGFINIWLKQTTLEHFTQQQYNDAKLGIDTSYKGLIIVDFSSPNIAKEMHVGHLRSTILGQCMANLLRLQGYKVLSLNHLGDWGTAFGMLIAYLKTNNHPLITNCNYPLSVRELVVLYRQAKKSFDTNQDFKKQSQNEVVKLQSGDKQNISFWRAICKASEQSFKQIYQMLDVNLESRGESFYNAMLSDVIKDFSDKKLLQKSDGAQCVFLDGFVTKSNDPLPLMIKKGDGGYNYATTDLAAIKHRINEENATRIFYVTDLGQALHFSMIFAAAEKVGYLDNREQVQHIGFGLVLGEDGKKLKTRSGDTLPLIDLLQEAIHRSNDLINERSPDIPEPLRQKRAKILGINAVKYADLSTARNQDYRFSYERMLRFDGNTANYILYAYVRIQSIFRKSKLKPTNTTPVILDHESEKKLSLHLIKLPELIETLTEDWMIHRLTDFLYELANLFHQFFNQCPILGTKDEASRLVLCSHIARTFELGCDLLGLKMLDEM